MTRSGLALVFAAILMLAALPASLSAAPYGPPPCTPPTFDGRMPAYVQSTTTSAVWMDPVVSAGDPFADRGVRLRYVGLPQFITLEQTVTFQLPVAIDGATLAFAGRDYPLTLNGQTATWTIPPGTSGWGPALLGTTIAGRPGPSYAMSLLVLPPGVPPPPVPGPLIPRCNPPPPQVCVAYTTRLGALARATAQARLAARRAGPPAARRRALATARHLAKRAADQRQLFAVACAALRRP